jgi:hypothetical protein
MNSTKTYFQDLALWSRARLISATYEGVVSCALTRLRGAGACRDVNMAPHMPQSRQVVWRV